MIFDQVCSEILSESSEMFVIIQQSIDAVVQQIQETKEYKTVSVEVQYLQMSVELSVQTDFFFVTFSSASTLTPQPK